MARSARWLWYLIGGGILALVEVLLPAGLLRESVYVLIALSAAAAVALGVRTHRPARRGAWYLIVAGILSWAVGDALWAYFDHVAGIDPFPSAADVFYLAAYPMFAGALYLLAKGRLSDGRRDVWSVLDALVVGSAAAALLWVAFIVPVWTDPEGMLVERVVAVAYPVGNVVLLVQLLHLALAARARNGALRLLGGAFALLLVTDVLFQAAMYVPRLEADVSVLDPGWLVAYLLLGAAGLHPAMRDLTGSRRDRWSGYGQGRVLLLGAAIMLLPVVVLLEMALFGEHSHVVEGAAVTVGITVVVVARMIDMVRHMRRQSEHLAHLADTDFLTGLDNRRRLLERLEDALDGAPGPGADATDGATVGPAVLLVGLERFTELNATLGYRVGDELLRAVSAGLREIVPPGAPIARVGGDVFGVLVERGSDEAIMAVATRIKDRLGEPFEALGLSLTVEAGVGVAVAPGDATRADDLLHRGDTALSAALAGPNQVARYAARMEGGATLAPTLMAELDLALLSGEVVVHFQPQVEVRTGRVLGAEALVRWQHPEHGLLGPMTFVPAAERTGLIRPLTLHVLDRALEQCALWRCSGRDLSVAVNLSVRNLLDPGLVDDVRAALERHRVDASCLELEITETAAMVDPARSVEVLGALNALGVTLSVDDYGTGYGSLGYLQRLPVTRLKIDRSFVAGVVGDPGSAAIVRSTIELARLLGLDVVAEGVEDDETLLALRDMGCFAAQGFGIGRPVATAALADLFDAIELRLPDVVRDTVGRPGDAVARRQAAARRS